MIPNPKERILVIISDPQVNYLLDRVLKSVGYTVVLCQDKASGQKAMESAIPPTMVIISERLNDGDGLEFAAQLRTRFPSMPILLFVHVDSSELLKKAMRVGINDYMCLPLRAEDILKSVQISLERAQRHRESVLLETRRHTSSLQRRMDETETLSRLGRAITSSLDLDSVLTAVVEAAVELTDSEEGSLLLLDEASGELYMRAARNFKEEFVRTFRLPIKDTLAGSVLRSGQPILLDDSAPQKIKTFYLVHSLIYVPLQLKGRVFGVLGVDNRHSHVSFTDHHVKLLSTLAEYTVVAIENARMYTDTISERNKLETILTHIHDGVIVLDQERHILLANAEVRQTFGITESEISGKPVAEVFQNRDLVQWIAATNDGLSNRTEISLEDGRTFSALLTPVPEVGLAVTLHDITYLKKLDQIKSDFVNTVSHDLRSPLTAILGYAELIERAGPINDLQRDFVQRVQVSVHNITVLVDDLLNLGRIEAGFDARKENVQIERVAQLIVESYRSQIDMKKQHLEIDMPQTMPSVYGNPVQLRQMLENLLDNAIKYTPNGGKITLRGRLEHNQIILQVIDTGIGIPSRDLPYVFDKFYRASNCNTEISGSGLGLAIVRSIVESHSGRVWVESASGAGSTFTIVLPLPQEQPASA